MIMQFINKKILGGLLLVVFLVIAGFYAKTAFFNKEKGEVLGSSELSNNLSVQTETVGENLAMESGDLGISWPGEIISLGDVEIQPQREGTITEWKVNIGQKVFKGQALGKLSAPPATPELVKMLAEQTESLAKAKGQAQAIENFTKKNKQQLQTLKERLENANTDKTALLYEQNNSGAQSAAQITVEKARDITEIKRQNIRKTIEEILNRHIFKFTGLNNLKYYKFNSVIGGYGWLDSSTKSAYDTLVFKLSTELKDTNSLPIETMQDYLRVVIRMVNNSVASEGVTDSDIKDARAMATTDQATFFEAINDYREAQMNMVMKEIEYKSLGIEQKKEFAEQIKEIDEKIAMLEKDEQMAMSEVKASQAAYNTVAGSIYGSLTITSSQNGVISAIYKKNGDFVAPGMPVASINAGDTKERFLRFNIPNNLTLPEIGAELTIMRPGFTKDIKKIKLVGIGTALHNNGSYVADAKFVDQVNWPVRASVRVIPPANLISNISIPLSAVWWEDDGQANVWLVTEENRIRPQPIKIGRTLGNKLEVLEGLQQGNKFISKTTSELVTGQMLSDIKTEDRENTTNQTQESDKPTEHGHEE
jgi:multidrug efflux pump subunit AcrA (membrane-fusion protein)